MTVLRTEDPPLLRLQPGDGVLEGSTSPSVMLVPSTSTSMASVLVFTFSLPVTSLESEERWDFLIRSQLESLNDVVELLRRIRFRVLRRPATSLCASFGIGVSGSSAGTVVDGGSAASPCTVVASIMCSTRLAWLIKDSDKILTSSSWKIARTDQFTASTPTNRTENQQKQDHGQGTRHSRGLSGL
eukprot:m.824970 g.824970  ORF g.824970 m.824970 type:complete len:186 (-) comp23406_c0_seq28:206-763(-)